jgi:hypothetical protein
MNRSTVNALALGFLMLAPALMAAVHTGPPGPIFPPHRLQGIYADVNIDEYLNTYTQSEIISNLYPALLNNQAVSGIVLYETWAMLNPNPPGGSSTPVYDWSLLDGAFQAAVNYNSLNSSKPPKLIQLVITPGFNSPQWVLDSIVNPCDNLFTGKTLPAGPKCGKATFIGFKEGENSGTIPGNPRPLPMPWDPTYKTAWQTFLTALNTHIESTPGFAPLFVSIAVAGPTARRRRSCCPPTKTGTTNTLKPAASNRTKCGHTC